MSAWDRDAFAQAAGGAWHIEPSAQTIDFVGVSIDTRTIEPGQVFFAFVGQHSDGHTHLEQAKGSGAGLCVVTDPQRVPEGFELPTVVVDEPQQALTGLARAWRSMLSAKVIAITGSNGKTTTCRLMHSVCAGAGKAFVSPKSFNNALGVPITILNTPSDAQFLVGEVGMSTPGEIAQRTHLLRPDIALITSIGRAHLEALGSVANIAREKAQIIRSAPEPTLGVIPGGIDLLEDALRDDKHRIERLGDGFELLQVTATASRFAVDGCAFSVPLPGVHNASNAALCVLAARHLGIDDATIRVGLEKASPPAMRFERVIIETSTQPITVINDAYNANPDSMRAALGTFALLDAVGPRVVVLGEMLEMGDAGPCEHQSLAEHAAGLVGIDRVILVGAGFADVADSGHAQVSADSSDESLKSIASGIQPGESLLIKGSRGVKLERLIAMLGDLHASSRSQNQPDATTHA
jgi:UDP-N-acetylmuramoyl-tripeptide--D-alanyl-D-alanine ligase